VTYEVPEHHAQAQSTALDRRLQQRQQQQQQQQELLRRDFARQLDEAPSFALEAQRVHADLARIARITEWQLPPAGGGASLGSCAVCLEPLEDAASGASPEDSVVVLGRCRHAFHAGCIQPCFKPPPPMQLSPSAPTWNLPELAGHVECPVCRVRYGSRTGDAPAGYAKLDFIQESLPGSRSDLGHFGLTIVVPSGVQRSHHPSPGLPFTGKNLVAYFPQTASHEGAMVVKRVLEAYRRRLLFQIGRSATTGQDNVVTFASIHLKTKKGGGAANHGFPDSGFLERISAELDSVGVGRADVPKWRDCNLQDLLAREVKVSDAALARLIEDLEVPPHDAQQARIEEELLRADRLQRQQAKFDRDVHAAVHKLVAGRDKAHLLEGVARQLDTVRRVLNFKSSCIRSRFTSNGTKFCTVPRLMATGMSSEEQLAAGFLIRAYESGAAQVVLNWGYEAPPLAQLAHLVGQGVDRPFLLICPFDRMQAWTDHVAACLPSFRSIIYHGTQQARATIRKNSEMWLKRPPSKDGGVILITSFETFSEAFKIKDVRFAEVVLDFHEMPAPSLVAALSNATDDDSQTTIVLTLPDVPLQCGRLIARTFCDGDDGKQASAFMMWLVDSPYGSEHVELHRDALDCMRYALSRISYDPEFTREDPPELQPAVPPAAAAGSPSAL